MAQMNRATPYLLVDPQNRTKVLQNSMSQHNVTNIDKLKLVNYTCKICNTENNHHQSFVLYGNFFY